MLILLDHQHHGPTNSFYGIANALQSHQGISQVWVASRVDPRNTRFFEGASDQLWARAVQEPLHFNRFPRWIEGASLLDRQAFDAVLLRLPRPIAGSFWPHLRRWVGARPIVNDPAGIERTSSKAFLLTLEDFTVPMRHVASIPEIYAFKDEYPIVLKPLEAYGGRGLVRIDGDRVDMGEKQMSFQAFAQAYRTDPQPYLAMQYLTRVDEGDKRIVVAGGKVLGQSLRLPAAGNWLCNVAQGGSSAPTELTLREEAMVAYLSPVLAAEGIFLYGLDTLMGDDGERVISEVNTLSVGGLLQAAPIDGRPVVDVFSDLLFSHLHERLHR